MNATTTAAPATTTPTPKAKKSKKHQISRSPEARKARRIIRQSLRYAIMSEAEDIEQEERDYYAEWLTENAELIDESLEYMASIRRESKPKAEKKSGTTTAKSPKKARKAKATKPEPEEVEELDDEDSEDEE